MDKINCIEDYFSGTRAYYLFELGNFFNDLEYKKYILEKKNLNAAKVAFVSNIMLGIKENMVDNMGNLIYQSKLFINSLENSVSYIATKVDNGYKIGDYIFPDASTLVAIVRNKLAHGKYTIDFVHNRVILEHKGVNIIVNIDKLIFFVIQSFRNTLRDRKTNKYERNLVYYTKGNPERSKKIKDLSEIKRMIKNYNYISFTIEAVDSLVVPKTCINQFELFLNKFGLNTYSALNSLEYKNLVDYLAKNGCKISYRFERLNDEKEIERIVKYAGVEIVGNDNLDYEQQIKLLGFEVHKSINNKYNTFNALASNINNLIILDAITKVKSVNYDDISTYISSIYPNGIKSGYDEFGMTLISMFNSLFMYPFDDVYSIAGEYTSDRSDGLDFANLDLSMIKPSVISIDDTPLINAKEKLDSIVKKQIIITKKILQQEDNLKKVVGNHKAESAINAGLGMMRGSLVTLINDYMIAYAEYTTINNDYSLNSLYFRNKAIIEGIRNSIAHGHYEFISNGELADTIIIFNDIYEGKLTFQVRMSFSEFEELINNNFNIILNFINKKIDTSVEKVLTRK